MFDAIFTVVFFVFLLCFPCLNLINYSEKYHLMNIVWELYGIILA